MYDEDYLLKLAVANYFQSKMLNTPNILLLQRNVYELNRSFPLSKTVSLSEFQNNVAPTISDQKSLLNIFLRIKNIFKINRRISFFLYFDELYLKYV